MHIPDKKGLREFGLITGGLFVGLFGLFFPWLLSVDFPIWPWCVAGVLWIWALLIPNSLKWVYKPWMLFAGGLGWINTRIILAIVFFVLMMPIGLLMRLLGKNPMHPKLSQSDSFRIITHTRAPKEMEHPF